MRLEEEEKELRITELQMHKANAMLDHHREIFSRPKRTWFQTHKERKLEEGEYKTLNAPVSLDFLIGRYVITWGPINRNPLGILASDHPKSAKIYRHAVKRYPRLLDFDGIGTVANAKHPWLGYMQS